MSRPSHSGKGSWCVRWQHMAVDRQDDGGEVYDISRQMTPLESRLESLAAAEEVCAMPCSLRLSRRGSCEAMLCAVRVKKTCVAPWPG